MSKDNEVRMVSFAEMNKVPINIICNGFDLKETILEVLKLHKEQRSLDDADIEQIAEDIKEALAVKLRLKQGEK